MCTACWQTKGGQTFRDSTGQLLNNKLAMVGQVTIIHKGCEWKFGDSFKTQGGFHREDSQIIFITYGL